jgi:hypothetical protein
LVKGVEKITEEERMVEKLTGGGEKETEATMKEFYEV